MNHLFPRHTKLAPPVAVGGEGCYLIDASGKRYFDGSGGAAVSCLGHGDREVTEAVKAQLDQLAFAHSGFFASKSAEALLAPPFIMEAAQVDEVVTKLSGAIETALSW